MNRPTKGRGDLIEGPIGPALLMFALPTLGSNILQSLNGSINAIWVGRVLGEKALAATANANIIMFLMFSVVFGFGMAATVVIAQSYGAGDMGAARRAFGSAVGFCTTMMVGVAATGWVGAPALLRILATPLDAFDPALIYLRVTFIAMPASLLSVMIMTGLRGTGDARTPFIFMLVSVAVDLVLNPVLIMGLGPFPAMGIAGSAAATAAAGVASLIGVVVHIYRKDLPLRLRGEELFYLKPTAAQVRVLVGKGLPMGLQMIMMSVAGLVMIGLVNREGLIVTAAYGATQQLWTYLQLPAMAMGGAVSAMAAQNIGAGRWDRVGRILGFGILYLVPFICAMIALFILFHQPLLELFLGAHSPAIPVAWRIQLLSNGSFVLFGCSLVYFGVMRANGAVLWPLLILTFALFPVRLTFYHLTYGVLGADALWLSFPLGAFVTLLFAVLYYRRGGWRKVRLLVPPNEVECREAINADSEAAGRISPTG